MVEEEDLPQRFTHKESAPHHGQGLLPVSGAALQKATSKHRLCGHGMTES